MRVAIIHYWLVGMRGGEKVIENLCEMYPQADIFTHVSDPEKLSPTIQRHDIKHSFIARLPRAKRMYQKYLPLMPRALEALDVTGYDLVISSEAGPAKGVLTDPDAVHICYCHSPMRYIWDQFFVYRAKSGRLTKWMMDLLAPRLRQWDVSTAARVDHFIANSAFIQRRISKSYRRDATVIFPPVDVSAFRQDVQPPTGDFYLYAGELVSYKKPDLVVETFNRSGKPLVVIGEGAMFDDLKAKAKPNITFLGRASFDVLKDHFARCRALIFPGVEDFGIIPLEVMAAGRPVIAYRKGGACETVVDGRTGVLFDTQSPEALSDAISRFEEMADQLDPKHLVEHASKFDAARFKAEMQAFIDSALAARDKEVGRPVATTKQIE